MDASRRTFLKTTAAATVGASFMPSLGFSSVAEEKVRLGIIGVGLRGQNHLELALARPDVEVVAICDVQQRMIDLCLPMIAKSGKRKPQIILDGPQGYKK